MTAVESVTGRAAIPGLVTAQPLIGRLPALYAQDGFTGRFAAGFDEVLAPVLATLDCIEAYWDARLAPEDFLDLLAAWVGADPVDGRISGQESDTGADSAAVVGPPAGREANQGSDSAVVAGSSAGREPDQGSSPVLGAASDGDGLAGLSVELRRDLVGGAVRRHGSRGTLPALAELLRLVFGVEAELADNGGTSWSAQPGGALPGTPEPFLAVRIRAADPTLVPLREISEFIDANRPAHVPAAVEVITAS